MLLKFTMIMDDYSLIATRIHQHRLKLLSVFSSPRGKDHTDTAIIIHQTLGITTLVTSLALCHNVSGNQSCTRIAQWPVIARARPVLYSPHGEQIIWDLGESYVMARRPVTEGLWSSSVNLDE